MSLLGAYSPLDYPDCPFLFVMGFTTLQHLTLGLYYTLNYVEYKSVHFYVHMFFLVQTFIYFEKPQEGSGGVFVDQTLLLSD